MRKFQKTVLVLALHCLLSIAKEGTKEVGLPTPAGFTVYRPGFCAYSIALPQGAKLSIHPQKECGRIHSIHRIRDEKIIIEDKIFQKRENSEEWYEEAVKEIFFTCISDGHDSSTSCDKTRGQIDRLTIFGKRAVKVAAPLVHVVGGKRDEAQKIAYAVELEVQKGRPHLLILSNPSGHPDELLDKIVRTIRSGLPPPTPAETAQWNLEAEEEEKRIRSKLIARGHKKIRNEFGGYLLEATYPADEECLVKIRLDEKCRPPNLPARILNAEGKEITTLERVAASESHIFEVRGNTVFWLERTDKKGKDLWAKEISSGQKLQIFPGALSFRASPDGSIIMVENSLREIIRIDRKSLKKEIILNTSTSPDTIPELQWFSDDGTAFFFALCQETDCDCRTYKDRKIATVDCPK